MIRIFSRVVCLALFLGAIWPLAAHAELSEDELNEIDAIMAEAEAEADNAPTPPSFTWGEPWQLAVGGGGVLLIAFWLLTKGRKIPDGLYSAGEDGKLVITTGKKVPGHDPYS